MTKHLVFLYQQGRQGIHSVFKDERLFRSRERRNFPQRSLANWRTNTYRFWFPPRWTSFIWRVKVSFASFHWCRRRCSCAWYNWPKFRILRPHGLQTRSENLELSCTKENPTWRKISLKTTTKHSFRFEGLKIFSDEECLCLERFPNWILKETPQSLQLSLALLSDITHYVARFDGSAPRVFVFAGSHCQRLLSKLIFIGYLLVSGNAVKRN